MRTNTNDNEPWISLHPLSVRLRINKTRIGIVSSRPGNLFAGTTGDENGLPSPIDGNALSSFN
jgi:hypothetical protein